MNPDGAYVEIQIETSPDGADVLAAELAACTGGIELRDAETHVLAPRGRTIVIAHAKPDDLGDVLGTIEDTLTSLRDAGVAIDPVVVRQRNAHEDEWRDVWKQFFRATRIGRHFIVRPSWDPGTIADGDNVIDLDPGRAFGTGAHPSTRLCIALMERVHDERTTAIESFLDLGCGSGILSIGASKLWPRARGLALDLDPEAAVCSQENFERNHVTTVLAREGSLDGITAADGDRFDLILANIQMDVLELLAPTLPARLAPNGHLVLSGLLVDQGAPTQACYERAGFALVARQDEGEWAGLLLRHAGREG